MSVFAGLKPLLIHNFLYFEKSETDIYDKVTYSNSKFINFVRVDQQKQIDKSGNNKQISKNITIYCYNGYTTPFLSFTIGSMITFNRINYIIVDVRTFSDIKKDAVISIEIDCEVM